MFEDAAAIFTTVWNFLAFGQQALYRDAMLQGYVQAASQLLVLALGSETSLPLPPAASGSSFLSKCEVRHIWRGLPSISHGHLAALLLGK